MASQVQDAVTKENASAAEKDEEKERNTSDHSFPTGTMDSMFETVRGEIEAENQAKEKIRDAVRDLEQKVRSVALVLQKIHQPDGMKKLSTICATVRSEFDQIRQHYDRLSQCIPSQEYFKYHDHYRYVLQQSVYLAALVTFLESGKMISKEDAASMMGVGQTRSEKFYLDLEDYLGGLLSVAPEMSRLAVNCVTMGDYERPLKISAYLNDLDAGFRLLNLKNDFLRKRFDGLKYEVKKVEEVVYDMTIRGLLKTGENP